MQSPNTFYKGVFSTKMPYKNDNFQNYIIIKNTIQTLKKYLEKLISLGVNNLAGCSNM